MRKANDIDQILRDVKNLCISVLGGNHGKRIISAEFWDGDLIVETEHRIGNGEIEVLKWYIGQNRTERKGL